MNPSVGPTATPPGPTPLDAAFDRFVGEPPPPPGHPARTAVLLLSGTVLPLVLLALDQNWAPFGMVGRIDLLPARPWSSVGIHLLAALLAAGSAAGPWAPPALRGLAAGAHAAGACAALGLGLYLLPFSLPGLVFLGLGLLGFVPFASSLAHGDAAFAGHAACRARHGRDVAAALGATGLLLFAGAVHFLAEAAVRSERLATAVLLKGAPGFAEEAEESLRSLRKYAGVRLDGLRDALESAPDPDPRDLHGAWLRITGWEYRSL